MLKKAAYTLLLLLTTLATNLHAERIRIVASIKPLCLIAEGVGGSFISCTYLVDPRTNPHSFEPTLKDAIRIKKADICLRVGLGFDDWMDKLAAGKRKIVMSEVLGIKGKNPHIWLDPYLAERFSEKLAGKLAEITGEKREIYSNLQRFKKALEKVIKYLKERSKGLKNRGYVAIHPAWTYFSRRFNLKEELSILSVPTGDIPYLRILKAKKAREKGLRVLVAEIQEKGRLPASLSKKLGMKLLFLDPLAGSYNSYPKFILGEGRKLIDALK